jgi:uroporphyrinogen decarboxylase
MGAMEKRLLRALRGQVGDRPPFWFMRQAGRYLPEYRRLREREPDFLRFCYTPDLAIEAALQPVRRYRPDAAILFSDILVVADALGRAVTFVEGQGPVLEPLGGIDDVRALRPERIEDHLAPVFAAVRGLASELPADVALIGFAGAPWTIALYMIEGRGGTDGGRARDWAYRDARGFAALIDVLIEATVRSLDHQLAAGAEAVQLFDSWAGLLAADELRRWVIAPTVEIVRRLRSIRSEVPVIGFPRGAGVLYRAYASETGVDVVGLDATVPVEWAAAELQGTCAVQGNLDNWLLRAGGPDLDRTTRRILAVLGRGPFIFNLGHGVLPDTPSEHVARVADIVRDYRPG